MKRIEAFLQPHRMSKVVAALHSLPRFPGFTVFEARGQGHGRGPGGHYVYTEVDGVHYHDHSVLVVLCEDNEADAISKSICAAAYTGNVGDGIVVITAVEQVRRIREAQQSGESAS